MSDTATYTDDTETDVTWIIDGETLTGLKMLNGQVVGDGYIQDKFRAWLAGGAQIGQNLNFLANKKSEKTQQAWSEMNRRLEDYSVTVTISGNDYPFGCDSESRDNIMGLNTAIAIGIAVPNPRDYTPKGYLTPVQCTHADLAAIGAALLTAKDTFIASYLVHKAAISALTTSIEVAAYDITTGWPA